MYAKTLLAELGNFRFFCCLNHKKTHLIGNSGGFVFYSILKVRVGGVGLKVLCIHI